MTRTRDSVTATLFVSGICCSSEEAVLRKRVEAVIDKSRYTFNPLTSELVVPAEEGQRVADGLRRAGFGLRFRREAADREGFLRKYNGALVLGLAFVLAGSGILLDLSSEEDILSRVLLLASIIIGGWNVFRKGAASLMSLSLDMNFLMSIAVIGAIAIDRWSEGAAVILLFGLSVLLESYSVRRTRRAINALMSAAPAEATLIRGDTEHRVPSDTVRPGDEILVRPGERVPLDGTVIAGGSTVDESAMTGEPAPVEKRPGSEAYAGSMNGGGVLKIMVTRHHDDTMLSRIIQIVEQAQQKKAPVQLFVDRFARLYTPAVFALAIILAILPPLVFGESASEWLYRAIVLLVIACPCALVISTPVTIVSAITGAARRGILIKGGQQIETLSQVQVIAFDKTGTLTHGRPEVTDIVTLNSMPEREVIRLMAALEHSSEHYLAEAVLRKADSEGVSYRDLEVEAFKATAGMGVQGEIDGRRFWLGSSGFSSGNGFLTAKAREQAATLEAAGKSVFFFGAAGEAIAIIAVRDSVRHGARETMQALRNRGIKEIVMLSGDNETAVREVAGEVGLNEVSGAMLPAGKASKVRDLIERHGAVAMVGDGVNDAPALASSSVGISMGIRGSDAALETSDVVLMSDDIRKLPELLDMSRKAMRLIRQNIALALAMKLVFLLLSISGAATLWMAVLADDGTALAVILNGLRVMWRRDYRETG